MTADDRHRVIADLFAYMLAKVNVTVDLSKVPPQIDPRDQQL